MTDQTSRHDIDSLASSAGDALGSLVRTILTEEGYPPNKSIPSGLEVVWDPIQIPTEFAAAIRNQVRTLLADGISFTRGHVFCHHCNEPSCEHSSPKDCGDVFVGYGPAGRPRFEAFFNYLLTLEDERVQGALSDKPQVVARVIGRRRLMADQLPAFGRGSLKYLIWGQVVAGYWRIKGQRYAMTLQVVETSRRQLRVQVIAHSDFKDRMVDDAGASPRGPLASVWELVREVSRKVENLGQPLNKESTKKDREEAKDKAFKLLKHFCLGVERKGRQQSRRTVHARKRGDEKRPVHKAYDDLQQASTEHFFSDEVKGSVVVIGRNGRVHVYAETGKHITSLNLKRSELERRQKRQRYSPLDPNKALALQQAASQGETR